MQEKNEIFVKKFWLSSNKVGEFMANTNRKFLKLKALSPIRIKKMRVDAWVKPFFAITYKANNAQGIIPFGISQQPVMAVREKNHLGRGPNLGWQGGNFGLWGPRRIFLAMCAPTFWELNHKIK